MNLIHGDCLEVMTEFPENYFDMVLADLPFGTTVQHWDKVIDMAALWRQYGRIVKPNGAIVLFAKPPFDKVLASSNLNHYRYDWVWEKTRATGHLNSGRMPLQAHEYVCVFYKKSPTYNPQKTQGHKPVNNYYSSHTGKCYGEGKKWSGGGSTERHPRSVLKFAPVSNKDRFHPNQKPVPLLNHFIKTYTNPGEKVCDNTMGAASTDVSCIETGREFTGIEKYKDNYDVAVERISNVKATAA